MRISEVKALNTKPLQQNVMKNQVNLHNGGDLSWIGRGKPVI